MQTTPRALLAAACALSLALPALATASPATASPATASPATASPTRERGPEASQADMPSPAREALARGDLEGALRLPARDASEATYLRARVHLARHQLGAAEALLPRLAAGSRDAASLAWHLAHARRDSARIATTAARVCALGDPTLRACADAEFYAGRAVRPRLVSRDEVEIRLSSEAPFPILLGNARGLPTGVVIDTGASQTVISAARASALPRATTPARVPRAVAGGGGVAEARLAVVPVLDLGGAQVWTLPVLVVDLPALDALGISVILSPQQALDGAEVAIDFPASRLRLSRHGDASKRPTEVDLPYYAAGFDLVVPARVGDGPLALFGFDTGMDGAFVLHRSYDARLSPERTSEAEAAGSGAGKARPRASASVLYGAGSATEVERVSPAPVVVAGLELIPASSGVRADMARLEPFRMAGLLGNDLWRDRVVTLDTRAHRIRLSEPSIP